MLTTETGEMFYLGLPVGTGDAGFLEAIGQLSVDGNVVTGDAPQSVAVFSVHQCPWDVCAVNNQDSFGPLSGTVGTRSTMILNGILWSYSPLYSQPSSLPAIAGSWSGGGYEFGGQSSAAIFSIDASGAIQDTDPDAGSTCVINGQVSLIDPAYNAYDITMTYSNCTDDFDMQANGLAGKGIGYIDNSAASSVLKMVILFANPNGVPLIGFYMLTQQ
jgi:hypothetical protein